MALVDGVAVLDPCMSEPCQNNGSCVLGADSNYTCSCLAGTTGTLCETSQYIQYTYGESDVISSYFIYAGCFSGTMWGKLCEMFVIAASLS